LNFGEECGLEDVSDRELVEGARLDDSVEKLPILPYSIYMIIFQQIPNKDVFVTYVKKILI